MELNIGINTEDRQQIAAGLSKLLADSYSLYLKTHNYHWNVTGPQFNTLHQMFEEQYTELAAAVDEIAERIRALGVRAPGSYKEYAALTNIAGATEWFSLDVSDANNTPYARTYTRVITDGTVDTLDHEDAHTVLEYTPPLFTFEKTAVNVTTGEDPATVATPGDTIRYTLRDKRIGLIRTLQRWRLAELRPMRSRCCYPDDGAKQVCAIGGLSLDIFGIDRQFEAGCQRTHVKSGGYPKIQ